MKPCNIIFFCLITTSLYLSSLNFTHASSSSTTPTPLTGSGTMRKLLFEKPDLQKEEHNIQVVERDWAEGDAKRLAVEEDELDDGDGDGLVYHVDYHGVSTHPYPTPKHPKP